MLIKKFGSNLARRLMGHQAGGQAIHNIYDQRTSYLDLASKMLEKEEEKSISNLPDVINPYPQDICHPTSWTLSKDPSLWLRQFWQIKMKHSIIWPVAPQREDRLRALCVGLTKFHTIGESLLSSA